MAPVFFGSFQLFKEDGSNPKKPPNVQIGSRIQQRGNCKLALDANLLVINWDMRGL